jgi:hypothetical protein
MTAPDRLATDRRNSVTNILVLGHQSFTETALGALQLPHTTLTRLQPLPVTNALHCAHVDHPETVLSTLARNGLRVSDFTHVWGSGEYNLVAAAVIGAAFGIGTYMDPGSLVNFRDKAVQKALVRAAHVPCARCVTISSDEIPEAAVESVGGFPCVIKPLASAGATLVSIVTDRSSLMERRRELLAHGHRDIALEEYIDGTEFHADGVVRDGRVEALFVSEYLNNCIEIREDGAMGSVLLDPERQSGRHASASDLAKRSLSALGMKDGVFHLEYFETRRGPVFSECAARAGGGWIADSIRRKFGFDMHVEQIRCLIGEEMGKPTRAETAFGWTWLRAPAGRVVRCPTQADVRQLSGVVSGETSVRVGIESPDMSMSTTPCAGRILVEGASEADVRELLLTHRAWFSTNVNTV